MKLHPILGALAFSLLTYAPQAFAQATKPMIDSTSTEPTIYERIAGDKAKQLSSHMNFHFCTTEHTDFNDYEFTESKFRIRRMRWEVYGDIAPTLSYHYRQSFNGNHALSELENITNSIEMAFVRWKPSQKIELMVGKQFLNVSGYECWVNGMDVREFSDFNDYFNPCRTGVTANIHFNTDQMLGFQVANAIPNKLENLFSYGVPTGITASKAPLIAGTQWIGTFADKAVMLQYSASAGSMAEDKPFILLTAGNIWKKGPVLAHLDFMYSREGVDTKGLLSQISTNNPGKWEATTAQNVSYFSTIAKLEYRFTPHWNAFVKGAFETANVYEDNGLTAGNEVLYKKGLYKRTWNGQFCVEYIPMPEHDKLRFYAHLLYKKYDYTSLAHSMGATNSNLQRITLGLVYSIPVF